jgi:hypothetical protein
MVALVNEAIKMDFKKENSEKSVRLSRNPLSHSRERGGSHGQCVRNSTWNS